MPLENHEKARFLLHRALVEGISLEDRRWLDAHVGQCAECGRYADLSARTVRALDWFALELDPAAALRVENVVRSRGACKTPLDRHSGRHIPHVHGICRYVAHFGMAGQSMESPQPRMADRIRGILVAAIPYARVAAALSKNTSGRAFR